MRESTMREAVMALVRLGPFPSEKHATPEDLEAVQKLLEQIEKPVSNDEARALCKLFGPDDCFGLAWTMVHLIETSPGWPLTDALAVSGNQSIETLRRRAQN